MTVRWGREKHSKLRSSTSKALAGGNMVHHGPNKRVNMVMRLKRYMRADSVGPYRLYKDFSLYPRTTGSPQNVFRKACYMIRFGFQKDLLWLLYREWTGWEKWSHMKAPSFIIVAIPEMKESGTEVVAEKMR